MSFKENWKNFITHPYASPLYKTGQVIGGLYKSVLTDARYSEETRSLCCKGFGILATGIVMVFATPLPLGAALFASFLGVIPGKILEVMDSGFGRGHISSAIVSALTSPFFLSVGLVKGIKNTIKYKSDVDGYRKMINPSPMPTTTSQKSQQNSRVETIMKEVQAFDRAEQKLLVYKLRESPKCIFNEIIQREVDTRISIENIDKVKNDIPRKRLHVPHRKRGKA